MTSNVERIEVADSVVVPKFEQDWFGRILRSSDGTAVPAKLRIGDEIMVVRDSGPGWVLVERRRGA